LFILFIKNEAKKAHDAFLLNITINRIAFFELECKSKKRRNFFMENADLFLAPMCRTV